MKTLKNIVFLLIAFYCFSNTNLFSQDSLKPNVLFIMCDDLNDYQGVFGGHPQAKTPNIDRLAKSGVQFINAASNVPVCQPSRNSLFSGVYPHDSKDYGWTPYFKQPVLKNNKTMMHLFSENGYKSLGTGKLMHGKPTKEWEEWGMNFKHNYGPFYFNGEKTGANPLVPSPYNSIGPVDGSYGRLSGAGKSEGKLKGEKGWVYGRTNKPMRYINDDDRDLLQDELHAKWAVKKLKELEISKQPFFLGVGFVRPHTPLHAPDKYFDMFPIDEIELAEWIENDEKDTYWKDNFENTKKGPKYYKMLLQSYDGDRELAIKHFLQAYLACVAFVDEQVGVILDALENSELKNNTIVVFTSDHGWQMGEKNYLFKNSPWEESARVPLIVKIPNQNSDNKVKQPVSLIDIFPTLIDYCKLEGSNKINSDGADLGGFSLRPLIEKKGKWEGPNGNLTIVGNFGNKFSTEEQNFSYRTENWRYIKYSNGKEELYNHQKDPNEWNNLAQTKKYKNIKKKLKEEMRKIIYKK